MKMDVDITDNIPEIIDSAREATARALEAVGLQAEGYAKAKCTVDTGLLRNSITHAVGGENISHDYKANKPDKSGEIKSGSVNGTVGSSGDNTVYIGTNVEYAPYVEYGTSMMAPRPYLAPAAENHAEEYKAIFEEYLKNA